MGEEAGDAFPGEAGGQAGGREVTPGDDSPVFMGIQVPRGEAWLLLLDKEA